MKNRSTFACLLLSASIFAAAAAHAAEVDFTENPAGTLDMGTVVAGQYGTISNPVQVTGPYTVGSSSFYADSGTVNGELGNNEEIVFTYTFGGPNYLGATLGSNGGSNSSPVYSNATTPPPQTVTLGGGIILATADLTSTGGVTTITNTSGSPQSFFSSISAYFKTLGQNVTLTYSVNAVPLPATLLLFGTAIAGMVGFSRFKRKSAESLAA